MKPKLLLALKVLKRFLLVVEPKDVVKIKENPEGFRELVATDPDGNRIRLFVWSAGR